MEYHCPLTRSLGFLARRPVDKRTRLAPLKVFSLGKREFCAPPVPLGPHHRHLLIWPVWVLLGESDRGRVLVVEQRQLRAIFNPHQPRQLRRHQQRQTPALPPYHHVPHERRRHPSPSLRTP